MRRTSLHRLPQDQLRNEAGPNSRHKHHIFTRHFLPKNERMDKMRYFIQINLPIPFRTNTTTRPPQLSTKNLRRRGFINPNLVH
jgi:hypothetical protein